MQNNCLPILGITMGDPSGIGPEIVVKSLADESVYRICRPLIVGDASVIRQVLSFSPVPLLIRPIRRPAEACFTPGTLDVIDLHNVDIANLIFGQVSAMAGHAAFEAIEKTIRLALDGEVDATVTAPIHKKALNLAGHAFAGHTEIFAHYTQARDVAMMLVSGSLRVIHVTTHVPMRRACDLIKQERVLRVIRLFYQALQQLGIAMPRIAVAGLNAHAGDGGLFGLEEIEEIGPAVKDAQGEGILAEGPLPPDTIFPLLQAGHYQGCVAMYHDQGHIPFKMSEFQWDSRRRVMKSVRGVNITVGLPIIRTSVDHGTAFPIAGKGLAGCESLIQAIECAAAMALRRNP